MTIPIVFTFHTGLSRLHLQNVRLCGSWGADGRFSDIWTSSSMTLIADGTGCEAFSATVKFDEEQGGGTFKWGVLAQVGGAAQMWMIVTETPALGSTDAYRSFTLTATGGRQEYWLATGRRFGAQKYLPAGATGIRFAVWAPYAQSVEVVFAPFNLMGGTGGGYVADDGTGLDPDAPVIALTMTGGDIWESDMAAAASLGDFNRLLGRLYMYRIVNEQGTPTYKVDLFSRNQAGRGAIDPHGVAYAGSFSQLDGLVSCSIVSDPDLVTHDFADSGVAKRTLVPASDFWANEFNHAHPLPDSVQDLFIYELHVGSLGYGSTDCGTLTHAMAFLDTLTSLGVNAVELLPMAQTEGDFAWGYGTSLHFCMQTSAGGGNQLKHFVRACHQRGIAVIMDVVYNHFAYPGTERSQWGYSSDPDAAPEHNIWFWYEGLPGQYADSASGYLNNGSSGYAPRFSEENVRQTFTSSAAALFDDFHIDGLRVDLSDAIHQNNALNVAHGPSIGNANQYGAKFLRELTRTVRVIAPKAFLMAEDYSGWSAMIQPLAQGGIGFDAIWYIDFYHHLIGDKDNGDSYAHLLKNAGFGVPGSLRMDYFAGALLATQFQKVAYSESHDEAGNDPGTERTIVTAVNGAPLIGDTRIYAEGRCRFCFGMTALCAATRMFFMGEEIGAAQTFLWNGGAANKPDLIGQQSTDGRFLFHYYQDMIRLVRTHPASRSRLLDVIHTHNDNRVIAFMRQGAGGWLLVAASLNDVPFETGYVISTDPARLPAGGWREIFNSDAAYYGGANIGNAGAMLEAAAGQINVVIPARGFVILEQVYASIA